MSEELAELLLRYGVGAERAREGNRVYLRSQLTRDDAHETFMNEEVTALPISTCGLLLPWGDSCPELTDDCPHQESNLGCRGHNATS